MKLLHTTNTVLNTRNFNKLSEKIIDSLYALNPEIQELYDIHINYIDDTWQIDFLPIPVNFPVIKVETYTDYDNDDNEVLHIKPTNLQDIPTSLKISDDNKSYDLCMNYVSLFEFVLSLYDFEYSL